MKRRHVRLSMFAILASTASMGCNGEPAPEDTGEHAAGSSSELLRASTGMSSQVASSLLETEATSHLHQPSNPSRIIDAVFAELLRHRPSHAVYAGDRTHDAELDDLSPRESARFALHMEILGAKL